MANKSDMRGHNGLSLEARDAYLRRILNLYAAIDTAKESFDAAKKEYTEDIEGIFDEASGKGFQRKVFKAVVRVYRDSAKLRKIRDGLEADERSAFDMMAAGLLRETLGDFADLPLGSAAVEAAERRAEAAERRDWDGSDDDADNGAEVLKSLHDLST